MVCLGNEQISLSFLRLHPEEGRTLCQTGGGQEELPYVRGQGRQLRGATPCPRLGTVDERSYPMPEARGSGWQEQPHLQGVVAARAQEDLEELFHFQGQKWRW